MSAQRTIAKLRSEVEFLHLACAQLEEQRDAQRIRALLAEERLLHPTYHHLNADRLPVWKS